MMRWVIRRQILDLRAESPTWYYLTKDGSWAISASRNVRVFSPLSSAEEIAKKLEAKISLVEI